MSKTLPAACLAVLVLVPVLAQQPQQAQQKTRPPSGQAPASAPVIPTLTLISPTSDTPIAGSTEFLAAFDPPDMPFASVDFLVNDEIVCGVKKPPIKCTADVGPRFLPRTVRALARLADKTPVVSDEVTTRGVDFEWDTGVVSVPVTAQVIDRVGNRVAQVPPSAFRIYEDSVLQKITDFKTEGVPLEIVVAVDVSDSMRDDLPVLKQAVHGFVSKMRLTDNLTVIAFNDRLYKLPQPAKTFREDPATGARTPVSVDNSALDAAVDRLSARENTALYYTIHEAVLGLNAQFNSQAVIVFTDGEDTYGHIGIDRLEDDIKHSKARLFIIAQGAPSRKIRNVVRHLTAISGGRDYSIDRIGELNGVLDQIARDIQNQYFLAYTPTNEAKDGKWRRIEVKLVGTDAVVQAREGYFAAKSEK
jgi:Ca-activated chloride channel homolog